MYLFLLLVEENHVITSELEGVIKEVMSIMESCKMNGQLQNYSLSFLTLSLIDGKKLNEIRAERKRRERQEFL